MREPVQRREQGVGQRLVEELRRLLARGDVRKRDAGLVRPLPAILMEIRDRQALDGARAPPEVIRQRLVEAREQDVEPLGRQPAGLLEREQGLSRARSARHRDPPLPREEIQHTELVVCEAQELAVIVREGRVQQLPKFEARSQHLDKRLEEVRGQAHPAQHLAVPELEHAVDALADFDTFTWANGSRIGWT